MSAAPVLPYGQKVAIPKEAAKSLRMVSRAEALVYQAANQGEDGIVWPYAITQELDKLTAKQRQYAIKVAAGASYQDAYVASYDVAPDRWDKDLSSEISALNRNPRIASAVLILRQYLDQAWLLDTIQVKDYAAARLYEESATAGKATDRIKATELLLRMNGALVDHKVITRIDASEADTQEALLKSILADIEALPVIETPLPALPAQPNGRLATCCVCGSGTLSTTFEGDGDGI